MDLQEISDRLEIVDLITAYTRAVDTRAYDDLREVFTEDAVLDYSSVGGPVDRRDVDIPWVEQGLAGFAAHQHLIGQVSIALDGDDAHATAYFTNPMVVRNSDGSDGVWECGGYYHHDLRRTPDGWRSTRMVDELVWQRGF